MYSILSKANKPNLLKWRPLPFQSIYARGLVLASSELPGPSPATKVLESFKEEFEVGSRVIMLETGKMARFANGAVVLGMEETKVLCTVAVAKGDAVRDFLPLTVDYQEKQFAQGVIPNTYMRREGAPKERELLCGRIIDRPIRPLFPAGFYHEVQIMASVLSSDGKQDPDVMAANAASAALMLSDIPWGGPIGVVRLGRISGQFVVNPTMDELDLSDLNLIYACTKEKTLMVDVQAREISERDLEVGLRLAHPEAVKYLEPQIQLAAKAGKHKKEYKLSMVTDKTLEKISNMAEAEIAAVFTDASYGKFERGEALDKITQDVKKRLEDGSDEETLKVLPKAIDTVRKQVVRRRVIAEGLRVDGRRLDEVRPLYCEAGNLPILHGSSLFSRGETQVLCTVTLGAPGDAQRLQSLVGPPTKRFMLHYSFPPFCINEVGKRAGLNRREVGHGTLAEKALLAVLPPEDNFPYTVRVNSEVMASDGSTSMASVCGGSMALLDAGIPLREHVAGISVGLVTEVDSLTGEIKDYRILTDILGLEDHLGDMDFKIAGTRNGVTAVQLDIKPAGIPLDIICECLEPAYKGRLEILDRMEQEISAPRAQDNRNAPQLATLKFSNDTLRRLIGPVGVLKRKIEEETGARLSVSDGTLTILAKNPVIMEKVQEKVEFIIGRELEVGGVYKGIVTSIKEYGAFVEFSGGQQGLLHISELSHGPVTKISDVISIGQQLSLMCIGQDVRGNIKLSLKATLPRPKADTNGVGEGSTLLDRETPRVWPSIGDVDDEKDDPANELKISMSSTPAVLVRSAAECDEEEKASLSQVLESSSNSSRTSKRINKRKTSLSQNGEVADDTDAILIRSSEEGEEDEKASLSQVSRNSKVIPALKRNNKQKKKLSQDDDYISSPSTSNLSTVTQHELNDKETESVGTVSTKSLKLGSQVTAKVHQVRARGLVLDLGGGIQGMYLFEKNGSRDFDIGDELCVKCTSFSIKGIPVMSLVDL